MRSATNSPDDPARAELRATLRELSRLLLPQHRALIHATKDEYAASNEPVTSPGQLLRLVSDDPFFAWLKPLTSLIVDIDELEAGDLDLGDAAAIGARVDRLFGASPDEEFALRYVPILQRDVDVAGGHAAICRALAKLAR
jgi:hypothetical protein